MRDSSPQGLAPDACCNRLFPGLLTALYPILSLGVGEQLCSVT